MKQEAIRKMLLAQKYQKEAIMELVPEEIRGNVAVIEREMKEIAKKYMTKAGLSLMQIFMSEELTGTEKEPAEQSAKVKKVVID